MSVLTHPRAGRSRIGGAPALSVVVPLLVAACGVAGVRVTASATIDRSLDVTPGAPVTVETFNGAIEVRSGDPGVVSARVDVTGSGATRAEAEADVATIAVSIESSGTGVLVRAVDTRTGTTFGEHGARITLSVPDATPLDLTTSNGPVTVRGGGATVAVRTSNGPVDVSGVAGTARLETSNGSIELTADDVLAELHTSNGPITFVGTLATGTNRFVTSNGRLTLRLPASAAFAIDGTTSAGRVISDFSIAGTLDERAVVGSVGASDDVRILARTSNGDLELATR